MSLIHDRAEVAAVACANPGSMADAVMARYGISRPRAQKLIHLARAAGHSIPSDAAIRTYDRAEIARVAVAGAPRMSAAVAAHFNVSKTHAHRLIEMSRHEGFNIPRLQRHPVTEELKQATRFTGVLECSCGWSCAVLDGALALATHTRTAHGRIPTHTERTPQTARKEAA